VGSGVGASAAAATGAGTGVGQRFQDALPTSSPTLHIEQPCEGERVRRFIQISGRGSVPPNRHLWAFVYNQQDLYWPWGKPRLSLDQWRVTKVMLGEEYPEDLAPYTVCAVVANDQANTTIEANWNRPGGAQGMSRLPPWADVVDQVTVVRVE
jgi:hypothetical protein